MIQRFSETLRFQDGARQKHSAPEATIEEAPAGNPRYAGELLAVLVDLNPPMSHRSRETRTVAAKAYWESSGGIVARLRRALAEANRYVMAENAKSGLNQQVAGSITCAAFARSEVFIGQVGPANALLYHPDGAVEIFPQEAPPMLPLGSALPPDIHVGYAAVKDGSTLLLATANVAEVQARTGWVEALSSQEPRQSVERIVKTMSQHRVSGCALLVRTTGKPEGTPLADQEETEEARMLPPHSPPAPAPSPVVTPPIEPPQHAPEIETPIDLLPPAQEAPTPPPSSKPAAKIPAAPSLSQPEPKQSAPPIKPNAEQVKPRWQFPEIHLPNLRALRESPSPPHGRPRIPSPSLKPVLNALLPVNVTGRVRAIPPSPPEENSTVIGGLALGLFIVVLLITVSTYLQFGGETRAQSMLAEVEAAWENAYTHQTSEDWKQVLILSEQILTLDPANSTAQVLRDEAQLALDALEHAALLAASQIAELGISPTPRRLLVAQAWVYLLNPTTDEVLGFPLTEDGAHASSSAPTQILRRGQTLMGAPVENLVDLAWMEPGPGYPDGAVFIYGDNGTLYIYEPSLGPASITRQTLKQHPMPGSVTLTATYGDQFYLIDRQRNQLFRYAPINGLYDSPPRPYFAQEVAPALQNTLDMELDGHLYLLLGDSSIRTYFDGTDDLSFVVQDLPDAQFHPTVMDIEPDPENGRIYLGDPQSERVVVLDKRGHFLQQYRLPGNTLKQLEALTLSLDPHVLYLIADNGLYAAPIPQFITP